MTNKPRHKAPTQAYFTLALIAGLFITGTACMVLASVVQEKSDTTPALDNSPKCSAPAKDLYVSREKVTGAYITTTGTPTAHTVAYDSKWATTDVPNDKGIWYAYGPATNNLLITSTEKITRITWELPDGSQRVQEGDLTYYAPETGEQK